LIPANDPNALAESIMRLSSNRAKLKQMALSARQMAVQNFSMESVARRLIEVFEAAESGQEL
jgi:glycosyltransferase involved in cell wall biosynthesis